MRINRGAVLRYTWKRCEVSSSRRTLGAVSRNGLVFDDVCVFERQGTCTWRTYNVVTDEAQEEV